MTEISTRLAQIKHFRFISHPGEKSVMRWSGNGYGSVDIEQQGEILFFHEIGFFTPDMTGAKSSTHNEFKWQIQDSKIELWHTRRGRENPIFLFNLVPISDTVWRSEEHHVCGDDLYSGQLTVGEELRLDWFINGPRKDEHLIYYYTD